MRRVLNKYAEKGSTSSQRTHRAESYNPQDGALPSSFRSKAGGLLFMMIAFVLCSSLVLACSSTPPAIPPDLGSSQIIQRAQERTDVNDWEGAKVYYRALLERFPNDPSLTLEAMYELAFIEYKQGHYAEARAGMQQVLQRYQAEDADSLPQTWKILAEKVLAKLPKS